MDESIRPCKINNLYAEVWDLLNENDDKSVKYKIKLMSTDSQQSDTKWNCWVESTLSGLRQFPAT